MPRHKKEKRKKKKEAARQTTLSRISDSRSIEIGLHHRFRLGSKILGILSFRAAKARCLLERGHQRATSKRPVCNYRHEAWPRGRTIGPLFISPPTTNPDAMGSARSSAPLRSHLNRRGISIGHRSSIRRF